VIKRVDFSSNANVYDRRHGAVVASDGLDRLWSAAALSVGARVLEVGAGTGRVAIPLAGRGCTVVAIEPARGMLDQLRAKDGDGKVLSVAAEGSRLPFPAGQFDFVVIARLLYLTPDWQAILREAHRVLAVGGRLLHEWGNGEADEEWVQIREETRRLFEHAGVPTPFHPGVRSEASIDAHLADLRLTHEASVVIGPGPQITIREFLRRLVAGELSYVWNVPQATREQCLPVLERWSADTFDLDRPVPMPREIRWTIHRKGA
jgi:SAM-dependent methyltransferase